VSKYASWTHGKLPLTELAELKRRGQKLAMVTAYDFPSGRIADEAGVELVLVGDSAGMVVLGNESTVPVTMDELLMLTRAVTRGAKRPLVIADMPFGSFQVSDDMAVENAVRFVKEASADAVKLEGAGPTLSRVQAIVGAGVPVMGHVGLTPQSATMLGGFKAQGRTAAKAERLFEDALALEAAGCFAIVLEAVPAPVAARVTEALEVPTIGIGAGAGCDGRALCGQGPALRQALRRSRRRGQARARGICRRRPRAPLPGGAAHLRDPGRGARGVRGVASGARARAVPPRVARPTRRRTRPRAGRRRCCRHRGRRRRP